MDSGNSGSMQSSSGGDEEYDSRADSISVFFNPPPPSNHHHNFHHQISSSSSSMFDPLSNYFDPLSSSRSPPHFTNPNSLLNLDLLNWSKNIRSDTNSADLGAFIASSSPTQQFFGSQPQSRPSFASVQIPQGQGSGSGPGSTNDQSNVVRNPKKRSRASRRAPTTVLTTDTTNFRAMVQEFTGIPAPPFTSSPFPRSRLDLFGTSSTFRSATHLESPSPPYLLRPFAHKIQPPFLSSSSSTTTCSSSSSSSSSMVDAIVSTTTNVNSASASATNSDLGLLNPILNFHPLFQPSPKFPFSNSAILGGTNNIKPIEIPANESHLKMGVFEDFGLGQVNTNLSNLQHMVPSSSSDHTTLRRSGENNWGGNEGDNHDHGHGLLRSINGNNGKVNYSEFHGDKGPENVGTRTSEGMMESWICSSD
ncbi:uncharacterized protein [Euphorbia lathyris]|uniref:uncharacterized protein n=1 Tax=Euphorbia lathyris TaxID=212925 RepID=UPI0033142EED